MVHTTPAKFLLTTDRKCKQHFCHGVFGSTPPSPLR